MSKSRIKDITLSALFASLIVLCAQISLPMPLGVAMTLQTFGVAMCAFVLGSIKGTVCVLVYILLGAVGLPVFSQFTGGIGILFGKSGGFLFGFLILAFLCGVLRKTHNNLLKILIFSAGVGVLHFCGILQFSLVTHTDFSAAFVYVSLPYILKDVLSVVCAYFLANKLVSKKLYN